MFSKIFKNMVVLSKKYFNEEDQQVIDEYIKLLDNTEDLTRRESIRNELTDFICNGLEKQTLQMKSDLWESLRK